MTGPRALNVVSIPPGAPFLPTVAGALADGTLVPGFSFNGDPLLLAAATIFVPTRRAARELRSVFAERAGGRSAILPTIRPLGEFDEEEAMFSPEPALLDALPPIGTFERLLWLAPLVKRWKRRLPAHLAAMFAEEMVVPASSADALWLARDLAGLIDEIETEGADWARLGELVPAELAGWWQVTLDFLEIVTRSWPGILAERQRSNPAAHRNALIRAEAKRLRTSPPAGPVIAAGSTGSIPATAELLGVIAGLPNGAVVLPGLDRTLDDDTFGLLAAPPEPSLLGHPQFGLARLLKRLGLNRADIGELGAPSPALCRRAALISAALQPAETTDRWSWLRAELPEGAVTDALAGLTLVEAAGERDEALAIAVALRQATVDGGNTAALVTADRDLARRVSTELMRFGIRADDSGGTLLARSQPAALLTLVSDAALRPGDPVSLLSLIKHPLLSLGLPRATARRAAELVELVALRGATGRPDIETLGAAFETRLAAIANERHPPFWRGRFGAAALTEGRDLLARLNRAVQPLLRLRALPSVALAEIATAAGLALEELGRDADGSLAGLYAGDAGQKLADVLRALISAASPFELAPAEWPDVAAALIGPEMVKPAAGADGRVAIWGTLEARLQSVDTLVLGGLNEGSWPRRAEADRFMSRLMKSGLDLAPPERRIGLAAHDFWMAMGTGKVVLTRAARAGDAPAVASRWLQRLTTFVGPAQAAAMRARGDELLGWARGLDDGAKVRPVKRPEPKPPAAARPKRFSVTEIETLRRDPYAVYAKRILGLARLDGLLRDPGAAERGTLFHDILHRFAEAATDVHQPAAGEILLAIGRGCFGQCNLPADVHAVWWPRFVALAEKIIAWERQRSDRVTSRHSEARARPTLVGRTGITLAGRADRIDLVGRRSADILDFKTGSSPSKGQAHTLVSPQLALEAALLERGAFEELGKLKPHDLAFVRLRMKGDVEQESVLKYGSRSKTAAALAHEAWTRLEQLLGHYNRAANGYLSRTLPFREGDMDGDYDHLARVLEWSAGADDEGDTEVGE